MMDERRYQAEKDLLERKLGANVFQFMDMNTSRPYLAIGAMTNRKNIYSLKIELQDFPNSIPKVFVTGPKRPLYTKSGSPMTGTSASMHTYGAENGCTRICHYGNNSWNPGVSLYKVFVKARLWLEMYELHLDNGRDIDYYLNHQN